MFVLKRGTPKGQLVWKGTCRNCNSVMEEKQSELTIMSDFRGEQSAEAKCPVCQGTFHLYPTREYVSDNDPWRKI